MHAPTCVASSSGQAPDSRVVMESPRCLLHEFWKLGWFHFCFFLNCFFLFYHSILYYWVSTIIRYIQELNNQIHILANVTLLSNLTLTNITLNPTDNSSWNFTKGFQRYCSIMGYNFISINARESITIQVKRCCLDFAIYCLLTCWFFYWKEFFYQ